MLQGSSGHRVSQRARNAFSHSIPHNVQHTGVRTHKVAPVQSARLPSKNVNGLCITIFPLSCVHCREFELEKRASLCARALKTKTQHEQPDRLACSVRVPSRRTGGITEPGNRLAESAYRNQLIFRPVTTQWLPSDSTTRRISKRLRSSRSNSRYVLLWSSSK